MENILKFPVYWTKTTTSDFWVFFSYKLICYEEINFLSFTANTSKIPAFNQFGMGVQRKFYAETPARVALVRAVLPKV